MRSGPRWRKRLNEIQAQVQHMQPLGLRSNSRCRRPRQRVGSILRPILSQASSSDCPSPTGARRALMRHYAAPGSAHRKLWPGWRRAPNAALEHQWIADDLSKVAEARDLNLERRADLEQARDILNDVHVAAGHAAGTGERAAPGWGHGSGSGQRAVPGSRWHGPDDGTGQSVRRCAQTA